MKHDLPTTLAMAIKTIIGTIYVLFTIYVFTLLFIAFVVRPETYNGGAWRAMGAWKWWVVWAVVSSFVWLGAPEFTLYQNDEVKERR
jgi:hypothetical protein